MPDIIEIYTDGGCRGNQLDENIGSWAAILKFGNMEKKVSGTAINTTNNIMELTAVVKALQTLKSYNHPIKIYSDSAYVCNGFNKGWLKNWVKNNWRTSSKKPVKNKELWQTLLSIVNTIKDIKFIWVRGHGSNKGNIEVDRLVNKAMDEI